ncbi:MAG: DoxX family membrane protein [Pseudomonadota bacterium]
MLTKLKTATQPYAMLSLRLALGLTLLVHGWAHVQRPGALTRAFERADLPAAEPLAWVAAGVELLGGLLVLMGFQARIAAFFLACWGFVQAFLLQAHNGWFADEGGLELPLLLALGAVAIWLGGAGRASVDSIRGKL